MTTAPREGEERAAKLRALGWSVAVHNDYRLDGQQRTFWLFTHPSGVWAKGEGATDADALAEAEEQADTRLSSAQVPALPSDEVVEDEDIIEDLESFKPISGAPRLIERAIKAISAYQKAAGKTEE